MLEIMVLNWLEKNLSLLKAYINQLICRLVNSFRHKWLIDLKGQKINNSFMDFIVKNRFKMIINLINF